MKKIPIKAYKIGLIVVFLVTGMVFFTSFSTGDRAVEIPVPAVEREDKGGAEGDEKVVAPSVTVPEAPESGERLEIDHPLPPEPVVPLIPMASAHFKMAEYACDCEGYCDGFPADMDPVLLEKLEALRCYFDRPIIITSGVRCVRRNAEVGGIPGSFHLSGRAADLYCPEVAYTEVAEAAKFLGLGVIEYPGQQFDHVEIWQ